MFDVKKVKNDCINWIREYFAENGATCNAIVGISGGKDSSVVATLCVETLGKDRVIGVLMPDGKQSDIDYSYKLVEFLGIKSFVVNIKNTVDTLLSSISISNGIDISESTIINLPARIRMATLFAISQSCNGRVANTCNLSEDWVGYATLFGDGAGQFSPLSQLTVSEVIALGRELGLPEDLLIKPPADGLTGKTDEDNFGFTYEVLDKYIRTGICDDLNIKEKIDKLHKDNMFKLQPMPYYNPQFKTIDS